MVGNYKAGEDRPYANGKEARIWHLYIGSSEKRLQNYKSTLLQILTEHSVTTVLDLACGTGLDSAMLVEEGYTVTSTDAGESFLKYARETRWQRRNEPGFENWQIGFGDWLDLKNCEKTVKHPEEGYDALICIGNSFCCLPDFEGGLKTPKKALSNFNDLLKPGGVLILDHRNYDYVIRNYTLPPNSHESIYYNSDRSFNVSTTVTFQDGACKQIATGLHLDLTDTELTEDSDVKMTERDGKMVPALKLNTIPLYPHTLEGITGLLDEIFTPSRHRLLPDFKEEESCEPSFYVHVVTKPAL